MTEGRLVQSKTEGNWFINDLTDGYHLRAGRTVELWLGGQWIEGHLEYRGALGGLHFVSHAGGYCGLAVGMHVRVPLD